MSNLYDVVGYAREGYATCPEHTPEDEQHSPIFEGNETDTDILCDVCYGEAFTQGLRGEALRDACLIVGKNIWYDEELKELARKRLDDAPASAVSLEETRYCWKHALSLLEQSSLIEDWYASMEQLVTLYDDLPSLFPEIAERYQETYGTILEEVQDYLKSKTEQ